MSTNYIGHFSQPVGCARYPSLPDERTSMLPSNMGMLCPKASLEIGKVPLRQVACVVRCYRRTCVLEPSRCCGSVSYLKGQLSV